MKPTEQQVSEWVAQIKSDSGEAYTQELCELAASWGAEQAQQTPVEEPELPEAVAFLFTNVQSGDIEASTDPYDKQGEREYWHQQPLYTATQMHDHFHAGVRAGMGQSQDAKLEPLVRAALCKAFSFGQRYWQQADSEYVSHHKKADETQRKFLALIEETIAAMQGGQQ